MAKIIHRKEVTYRWVCTDKDRCEQIDEQIDSLTLHASHLSSYVEHKQITGLECLYLDNKFKWALKELRDERKTLWRRVRREIEEEIVNDTPADFIDDKTGEVQQKYVSPFAPPNMVRVL